MCPTPCVHLMPAKIYIYRFYYLVYMYTIVLVNVERFRALCGFYAIENKLLLLLKEWHS